MKKTFLLLLSFVIISTYSQSQIAGKQKVFSLDDCINIALNNNYNIILADARTETASSNVTSAFGSFLPSIGINSGYTRQLNAKPGFGLVDNQLVPTDPKPNTYSLNAGAQWLIFDGFARENNYNRAHESFNSYKLNATHLRKIIKIQIFQNYVNVIAKQQIVKARRENLELGKKELERIVAQNQAGLIAKDVVYSQEAEMGNREYELVNAENSLNLAKADLLILMGLQPDIDAEFLESSLPNQIDKNQIDEFRNLVRPFRNSNDEVFNNRFDYLSGLANIKASESNLNASHSGYYPSITASGGWGWSNYELDNFSGLGRSSLGLNLYIPIFDQFSTNTRIQSAELQLEQAKIEQKQLEQNILSAIKTAYLNLDASEKQLDITERALRASELNNQSLTEKFRVGSASVTEYLTANTQLITSQINRINAIYQYFKAQKELLYAIGKLE
jgi:outer membrane protein